MNLMNQNNVAISPKKIYCQKLLAFIVFLLHDMDLKFLKNLEPIFFFGNVDYAMFCNIYHINN